MEEQIKARAALFAQMSAFMDAHPEMSDDQVTEYEALEAEYNKIDMSIVRHEAQAKRQTTLAKPTTQPMGNVEDPAAQTEDEYKAGFDAYLATGNIEEYKASMTVKVDADGGFTVPEAYQNTVVAKLNALSATRGISTVLSTNSTTNIPTEGEAPTFAWIDEEGAYGETKSTFGNKKLGAYKLGGIIKVSRELLQDTAINFDSYMAGQIALGIDKAESPAFAVGDGVGKPKGYAVSATVGASSTTASVGAVTSDELIDIFYDLKAEYRQRATWRCTDATLKSFDKLKDGQGNYILGSLADGMTPTIKGRPVVVDNNMAELGTGNKFVVFGDFSYFQIADRGAMTIQRLDELYAGTGMVGFQVTVRVDAKTIIDEAFNAGQNA
jgi:HK97 family phage major capsid protein